MGSLRSVSALMSLVCVALACAPSTGTGAALPASAGGAGSGSSPGAGALGLGDPVFPLDGNGGYDARHYLLKLSYVPSTKQMNAVATIEAKAEQGLTRFNFDFAGLKISKITVNGQSAAFSRKGAELTVVPKKALAKGETFTTAITYSGRPAPLKDAANLGTYGFIPTADGAFVTSEPNGSKSWFPANDHPSDKALFDFVVTVPAGTTVLANGEMTGKPVTAGGKTTFVWSEKHPMATYLATVTMGKFQLKQGKTPGGIPNLAAVDPKYKTALDDLYSTSGEVTDYWSTVFGPYPFSSTGGVIDDYSAGYALENQTKPMYGGFTPDSSIIAHELAHQWFGDSLTITRWKDLWLNEGFASYAEWLWSEHKGRGTAESLFKSAYARATGDAIWAYPPGVAQKKDLFNESVYTRGGMTLHALRQRIGDKTFFALLKQWTSSNKYGYVNTKQFIALAEKMSGKDLGPLFDAWLFQPKKPTEW